MGRPDCSNATLLGICAMAERCSRLRASRAAVENIVRNAWMPSNPVRKNFDSSRAIVLTQATESFTHSMIAA